MLTKEKFALYLDLANHNANSTEQDIEKLCSEVIKYGFHSAFVNSCYIEIAKKNIANKAAIGTVVSFPLGQDIEASKIFAAQQAVIAGANELDVSINVGLIKEERFEHLLSNMTAIVSAAKKQNSKTIVKFIIETGYLSEFEIGKASELVVESGADFVKTCSGYGPRGAKVEDVHIIKEAIGNKAKIKVAGGISTLKSALEFINAGADRIGTSKAVNIMQEYLNQ